MARSSSSPPSSSCSTTCCSSRNATSKLRPDSGFGLNGFNPTGQSTAVQLNTQAGAWPDRAGVVQDLAVRLDDGVPARQRGRRTERVQAPLHVHNRPPPLADLLAERLSSPPPQRAHVVAQAGDVWREQLSRG